MLGYLALLCVIYHSLATLLVTAVSTLVSW